VRSRRWWLAAAAGLVPAMLGLVAALWLPRQPGLNPVVFARAPAATWLSLCGIAASGLALSVLLWVAWTERQRADDRRKAHAEALEERRRFLRRLDHELKNPLTAIRAGLALLPQPGTGELAPPGPALATVEAQVRRVSRLTADLRKLAELEDRPLELATVDLGDLLDQVFELTQERPEAGQRRLTLSLPQAPWPLPPISGDHDLLLLVAHNLLDNAVKFSRPGDTLEVRAFEDGNSVVVEVADTGPGIPEDELPHVWDELYRGAGARGVPGSGLGLPLARAIIIRHGGQVAIRSRAGQGTVVTVRLPIGHQ
jgi:two-component system, OmpR family, sensor kinase